MKKIFLTGLLGLLSFNSAFANNYDCDGSWLVRVRGIGVIPAEKSSISLCAPNIDT